MKALWEILENKTLILISHRLENLQKFDRIYVMNEGRIVESGSYEQLLNSPIFNQLRS
jgi:ABC-type bacteriocin/lantibiotic exporter with double-glycine peptidase domain